MIPTIVPAIRTIKQLIIEKSIPIICTNPNKTDGTSIAALMFYLAFIKLSITPRNTISSTKPAAIPVKAMPALNVEKI